MSLREPNRRGRRIAAVLCAVAAAAALFAFAAFAMLDTASSIGNGAPRSSPEESPACDRAADSPTDAASESSGEFSSKGSGGSEPEYTSVNAADHSIDVADGGFVSTEIPDRDKSASADASSASDQTGLGSSAPDNDVYVGD